MKKIIAAFVILFLAAGVSAFDYSGVYTYNKGLNKASGTLFVFQFKPDSAFFYLCVMSGNPDFLMTNLKGFMKTDSTKGIYTRDSCRYLFSFEKNAFSVSDNSKCRSEFSADGQYKKSKAELKRSNTWMTEYTEKGGTVLTDSTMVLTAPHAASRSIATLPKDTPVKILDEINGFYLVEQGKKKNEFMWIRKKNVTLNKK